MALKWHVHKVIERSQASADCRANVEPNKRILRFGDVSSELNRKKAMNGDAVSVGGILILYNVHTRARSTESSPKPVFSPPRSVDSATWLNANVYICKYTLTSHIRSFWWKWERSLNPCNRWELLEQTHVPVPMVTEKKHLLTTQLVGFWALNFPHLDQSIMRKGNVIKMIYVA